MNELMNKREEDLPKYTEKGTTETFDHLSFQDLRKEAKGRGLSATGSADAIRGRLNEVATITPDEQALTLRSRREMRRRGNNAMRKERADWYKTQRQG